MAGHDMNKDVITVRSIITLLTLFVAAVELLALTGLIPSLVLRAGNVPLAMLHGKSPFLSAALAAFLIPAFAHAQRLLPRLAIVMTGAAVAVVMTSADNPPTQNLMALLGCLGMSALGYLLCCKCTGQAYATQVSQLFKEATTLWLFVLCATSALELTAALRPLTLDRNLLVWDLLLFGDLPARVVHDVVTDLPLLFLISAMVYLALPFGLMLLRYWQLSHPGRIPFNVTHSFLLTGALGFLLYFLFPVCGPKFILGSAFPDHIPDVNGALALPAMVDPFPRNGMPSLHTAWAMIIALATSYLGGMKRFAGILFLLLTVLATLMLGEHYVLDLYAAIPFALLVNVLLTPYRAEDAALRMRHLLRCGLLTLILASTGLLEPEQISLLPMPVWHLILGLGLLLCLLTFLEIRRLPLSSQSRHVTPDNSPSRETRTDYLVTVLFFVSGFAALVYQVLFSKFLGLTFGSTAVATYTVLATYMIGLASGTVIGGWLASRLRDPVKAYAIAELAIAAYCLATPFILAVTKNAYVGLATGLPPDADVLVSYKVFLGAFTLLVPTILMGLTTPMLLAYFNRREGFGASVARLYGANTIGASAGALCTGYFLMPWLGANGTLLFAIAANVMIFFIVLGLRKRTEPIAGSRPTNEVVKPHDTSRDKRRLVLVSTILFVCGFITLSLETLYIQLLAVVAGNSAYAFSLMLFSFLAGLGLGAHLAKRLLATSASTPEMLFFKGIFFLIVVILLSTWAWDRLPMYFAGFDGYPLATSFGSREIIRGLTCVLLMIPPAICIGFCFPLAMEILGRGMDVASRPMAFGIASAFNTAGNIAGVLIGGFILLPAAGSLLSLKLIALLGLLLLAIILWQWRNELDRKSSLASLAAAGLLLMLSPQQFNLSLLASGANVYFSSQAYGEVIDHAESIDGGLTTVNRSVAHDGKETLTLLTNGKFQGDNSKEREMAAQVGFVLAPLLHTEARENALVIGYGTGVSARTLHDAQFKQLDIVDISGDILEMADKHFSDVNMSIRQKPHVQTHVTDGRNFLLLNQKKYDLISMEISSIWFAGAASLYNDEFYALARNNLKNNGVLQQWIQLHRISQKDIAYIISTLRNHFKYTWLYFVGNQGILVATNDAQRTPNAIALEKIITTPSLRMQLDLYGGHPESLLEKQLLGPDEINRFVQTQQEKHDDPLIATDDNLYLEYSTPKGNIRSYIDSLRQNVAFLTSFRIDGEHSQ
ncbi:fused MFS/spermidine synthase [Perlucidibaca piscinae]|uniref:fused MFS/spermidine synthase n=1 Tax=Perlucidibaca piscinae TaxID=392589 RepID=UPI0003B75EAC|nr:fused MFS/spermidine synthase [Perlucidibaca piscinae]